MTITVATADFDRNKLAVALGYDRNRDDAPRLVAKGQGFMAEQIIELAKKHQVEIREDRDLVTLLSKLDIDTPIPTEAYAAVAEILAYIYKANSVMKGKA